MIPNRRQFVASLAGVPVFLQAASAQQPSGRVAPAQDPVLQQVLADIRELTAEGETQPNARKAAMRGIETSLGILAAHFSAHYDRPLQSALRRREAQLGRAALVGEIVDDGRRMNHALSHENVEEGLRRFSQVGLAGALRNLQRAQRNVRLNAPDAIQAATMRRTQYSYCDDLAWQIQMLEAATLIACAIAMAEPTPLGEAACVAMSLMLASLLVSKAWWC
ncbi:MAG: hypothetical protein ACKOEC_08040 [Acidimicrobiia bacterium]